MPGLRAGRGRGWCCAACDADNMSFSKHCVDCGAARRDRSPPRPAARIGATASAPVGEVGGAPPLTSPAAPLPPPPSAPGSAGVEKGRGGSGGDRRGGEPTGDAPLPTDGVAAPPRRCCCCWCPGTGRRSCPVPPAPPGPPTPPAADAAAPAPPPPLPLATAAGVAAAAAVAEDAANGAGPGRLCAAVAVAAAPPPSSVLPTHSLHPGYSWSEVTTRVQIPSRSCSISFRSGATAAAASGRHAFPSFVTHARTSCGSAPAPKARRAFTHPVDRRMCDRFVASVHFPLSLRNSTWSASVPAHTPAPFHVSPPDNAYTPVSSGSDGVSTHSTDAASAASALPGGGGGTSRSTSPMVGGRSKARACGASAPSAGAARRWTQNAASATAVLAPTLRPADAAGAKADDAADERRAAATGAAAAAARGRLRRCRRRGRPPWRTWR
eukprot:Rhum_TRINITY_DN8654_c0_g1::Rhum_TRINITY_DN8654_c0_g1_i1::g.29259::m.29259